MHPDTIGDLVAELLLLAERLAHELRRLKAAVCEHRAVILIVARDEFNADEIDLAELSADGLPLLIEAQGLAFFVNLARNHVTSL